MCYIRLRLSQNSLDGDGAGAELGNKQVQMDNRMGKNMVGSNLREHSSIMSAGMVCWGSEPKC